MTGDLGGTEGKVASWCVVTIEICQNDGSILENIIYGCHVLIKGRYRRACGVIVLSLIRQTISILKKVHSWGHVNSFLDKSIDHSFTTLQKDHLHWLDCGNEIENLHIYAIYPLQFRSLEVSSVHSFQHSLYRVSVWRNRHFYCD